MTSAKRRIFKTIEAWNEFYFNYIEFFGDEDPDMDIFKRIPVCVFDGRDMTAWVTVYTSDPMKAIRRFERAFQNVRSDMPAVIAKMRACVADHVQLTSSLPDTTVYGITGTYEDGRRYVISVSVFDNEDDGRGVTAEIREWTRENSVVIW